MKTNKLVDLIEHFDLVIPNVDFAHLPERESEDYRMMVLQTANDKVFHDGSSKKMCEWKLDVLPIDDFADALRSVADINALTDEQRKRLRFYLDLQGVCYPLLCSDKIDWTAWPWNIDGATSNSMYKSKLFDFITTSQYTNLCAAMCLYLKLQVFDDNDTYTPVMKQDVAESFYKVRIKWEDCSAASKGDMSELRYSVSSFADELSSMENHVLVGRLLGLDYLGLSVYDAISTFVDNSFYYGQIIASRDMASWLKDNWDMDNNIPSNVRLQNLLEELSTVMSVNKVESPDFAFAWDLLTYDVLGLDMEYGDNGFVSPYDVDGDEWLDD